MKLKALFAVAATALLLTVALSAEKVGKVSLDGIKCPLSGKNVTKCSVAYKDGRVYFCCGKCAKKFKADPAKYAAKANLQLYATKQAKLVRCPFTCKKLNGETAIDVGGTKVCFCCEKCKTRALNAKDTVQCVFNDKQFTNGFQLAKKEKKSETK